MEEALILRLHIVVAQVTPRHTLPKISAVIIRYVSTSPIKLSFNSLIPEALAVVAGYNTANYAGYFCIDSQGGTVSTTTDRIPGKPTSTVTDGKCH